jgi:hypothetical protein
MHLHDAVLVEPGAIDAQLAGMDDAALMALVDRAGVIPFGRWQDLTPIARQALRASNLLAQRARAAEATQDRQAAQIEARAILAQQQRAARDAADLAPLLEKKRREPQYR